MKHKKLSWIIAFAVSCLIVATTTCLSYAADTKQDTKALGGNVYSEVSHVADMYISAIQKGDVNALKAIFVPDASYYFFHEGKLVGGGIDILYKTVEGTPIPKPIVYDVISVQVSERIASITLDIRDLMGVHIIDMFTLVQDDNKVWKMTSKVARRQS